MLIPVDAADDVTPAPDAVRVSPALAVLMVMAANVARPVASVEAVAPEAMAPADGVRVTARPLEAAGLP